MMTKEELVAKVVPGTKVVYGWSKWSKMSEMTVTRVYEGINDKGEPDILLKLDGERRLVALWDAYQCGKLCVA